MNRIAKRTILVFFILALLFSINCVGDVPLHSGDFEGCFQGADSEGQPIILTLNSPDTITGGASDALAGSLSFVFQELSHCSILEGQLESPDRAELKGTGDVPITITRTEADGTVTMIVKFSDESSLGPLERRGDPEELCPTEPAECSE